MQAQAQSYPLDRILALIVGAYEVEGVADGVAISSLKPVGEADAQSLAWIDPSRADKQQLLDATRAAVIVGDGELELRGEAAARQALIKVANPKLTIIRIAAGLFEARPAPGVHPSAVVDPQAQIGADVFIGPLACIGKAQIGAGSAIHSGVHIYDNVRIGSNVTVQSGCVIGAAGPSLAKDEAGALHNFPHLGGVVIEDDVELQALCVVDRGVLGDTVIGAGSVINSGCYIAHNSRIGRHNFLAGHTMISGSVVTGDHCWFAPAVVTRDRLRIGAHALVGTGGVVVNNLAEHARVMGNPARDVDEAKSLTQTLRRLQDSYQGDT